MDVKRFAALSEFSICTININKTIATERTKKYRRQQPKIIIEK